MRPKPPWRIRRTSCFLAKLSTVAVITLDPAANKTPSSPLDPLANQIKKIRLEGRKKRITEHRQRFR